MERTIEVSYLARVEGEGALTLKLKGDRAESVQLRIFEPPRFFEALLRGRHQLEAPDITSRICGICPVAYMMSACHAVEAAHGIVLPQELTDLRRLLYCGEWLESHVLHMFMLHAPDFLGYQDSISMAKDYPTLVRAALRMKKTGNAVVAKLGGREIHPINVKVGGFYRAPTPQELRELLPELEWARGAAEEAVEQLASFDFPDFERDYEFVALTHDEVYAFCEGRLTSNKGLNIGVEEYNDHFEERHIEHSTALHSVIKARGAYHCGPLARVNLSFERLGERALNVARKIGFRVPCRNPFKSLLARGLETIFAFDEAIRLIEGYRQPTVASVEIPETSGVGCAATEAPRGVLFHRYHIDPSGLITDAQIVPPTSQNQKTIEEDLFDLAPRLASTSIEEATWLAEQAIRNYDPCISCSTHFLKLQIERKEP